MRHSIASFASRGTDARQRRSGGARGGSVQQPDAAILDVKMPFVDGMSVTRRLRDRGDRTPILILTARQTTADRVEGLDAGADDYLPKPFELDDSSHGCERCCAEARRNVTAAMTVDDLTSTRRSDR